MLRILAVCFTLYIKCSVGNGPANFQNFASNRRAELQKSNTIFPYTDDVNSYTYWNCHNIPPNMTLCKGVGYSRMVLPNFLQHESLREVIQQANVWVALVNTDCHPDIQRFLCSLYAPVCLKSHQESKIPPCWELCSQVRNACLPRMRLFGFDWPEIVQCNQYPRLAESMCIPPQENTTVKCAPCEQALTLENIASSYCMADVVLKMAIEEIIPVKDGSALRIKLSSRTRVLKLHRRDGIVATNKDIQRLWKRSRLRRHELRSIKQLDSRFGKHAPKNNQNDWLQNDYWMRPVSSEFHNKKRQPRSIWNLPYNRTNDYWMQPKPDRRKRRNPNRDLHDLDGIREVELACSACSGLKSFSDSPAHGHRGRWLVMGRRVKNGNHFTNMIQLTLLMAWDRNSPEFKHALNAIRTQPVARLCPKKEIAGQEETNSLVKYTALSDAPNLHVSRLREEIEPNIERVRENGFTEPSNLALKDTLEFTHAVNRMHSRVENGNHFVRENMPNKVDNSEQVLPQRTMFEQQPFRHQYTNLVGLWRGERLLREQPWISGGNKYQHLPNYKNRKRRRRRERGPRKNKNKDLIDKNNQMLQIMPRGFTNLRKEPINPYSSEDSGSQPTAIWVL